MKPKHQRLLLLIISMSVASVIVAYVLYRFSDNLVFFYTPSQMQELKPEGMARLGGLVETGSVDKQGQEITFSVTDGTAQLRVHYSGELPTLFREGQGVVAQGILVGGVFKAENILAKHDENYMPPEVAKALKESGYWQHEQQP